MRTAAAALLILFAAAPVSAQCSGDMDQDGQVSVADVIAVVNQALGDCGTPPTPTTACPYTLSQNNGEAGQPYCVFAGLPRSGCSAQSRSEVSWLTRDGQMIVIFPDVYLFATITGPRQATITAYFTEPDASDARPFRGLITLTEDGAVLHITPLAGERALYVNGCALSHYAGTFVGVRYDD